MEGGGGEGRREGRKGRVGKGEVDDRGTMPELFFRVRGLLDKQSAWAWRGWELGGGGGRGRSGARVGGERLRWW